MICDLFQSLSVGQMEPNARHRGNPREMPVAHSKLLKEAHLVPSSPKHPCSNGAELPAWPQVHPSLLLPQGLCTHCPFCLEDIFRLYPHGV